MGEWKPQLGRITFFPLVPAGTELQSALDLYKAIWRTDPDSFQKQPPGLFPFAVSTAQGTIEGLGITCSVQPARIDFLFGPKPTTVPSQSMPLVDRPESLRKEMSHLITISGESELNFPAVRLACAVQFASVASTTAEANQDMSSVLPAGYRLRLSDEEDFVLQINRPRQGKKIKMNYVTKWAVEKTQILTFLNVGAAATAGSSLEQFVTEFVLASISIDNSSIPSTTLLSKEDIPTILAEALDGISQGLAESTIKIEGF
jgi:hypothetical protein